MKQCDYLNDYLARIGSHEQFVVFEDHLTVCTQCYKAVYDAHEVDEQLLGMFEEDAGYVPTLSQANKLVWDARAKAAPPAKPKPLIPIVFAATAGALITLLIWAVFTVAPPLVSGETVLSDKITVNRAAVEPISVDVLFNSGGRVRSVLEREKQVLAVPDSGRLLVQFDGVTAGIDKRSQMSAVKEVDGLWIYLEQGTAVFDVLPRKKQSPLRVVVNNVEVLVVGTRFWVSANASKKISVGVLSGRVAVSRLGVFNESVFAGEQLTVDGGSNEMVATEKTVISEIQGKMMSRLLSPESIDESMTLSQREVREGVNVRSTVSPQPTGSNGGGENKAAPDSVNDAKQLTFDYDAVRELIVSRQSQEAGNRLREHLAEHPKDVVAWSLLANALKRVGNWPGAVDAFGKVQVLGAPREVNRARFNAAVILQDKLNRQRDAAVLFEKYLLSPLSVAPLEAESMYRLALTALATNQRAKGLRQLEEVARKHNGTAVSVEARRILAKEKGN